MLQVFCGYDRREPLSYEVAVRSLLSHASIPVQVMPLVLADVKGKGLFSRPAEGSTDFSTSRFLVPLIATEPWALFTDSDVLWLADIADLMRLADPRYAVQVVKHDFRTDQHLKMDRREQRQYPRKLWSSVALFHVKHPANRALTIDEVNTRPRDWLHAFGWLPDDAIGELPERWNWIPGHSRGEPALVHFTEGSPELAGFEQQSFADQWRAVLANTPTGV